MSTLVIFMCFVAIAKATLPLVDVTNAYVSRSENVLTATESRFYEKSIPSLINAREAIRNIDNDTIRVGEETENAIRHEWEKLNTLLIEPARNNGTNITECNRLYDELHDAYQTVSVQVMSCTDDIIQSITEQITNIEKLADQVMNNFNWWRAEIHRVPVKVNDFESLDIASSSLFRILYQAQWSLDNNYLPKLRANSNSVKQLTEKHRECFSPNIDVFTYEMKYSNLGIDIQKCIQRMTRTHALKT